MSVYSNTPGVEIDLEECREFWRQYCSMDHKIKLNPMQFIAPPWMGIRIKNLPLREQIEAITEWEGK